MYGRATVRNTHSCHFSFLSTENDLHYDLRHNNCHHINLHSVRVHSNVLNDRAEPLSVRKAGETRKRKPKKPKKRIKNQKNQTRLFHIKFHSHKIKRNLNRKKNVKQKEFSFLFKKN